MKSYLAVYSGNAYAEGSTFSAGRSNINGFVQFQSDETDDSKLLILAKNSVLS